MHRLTSVRLVILAVFLVLAASSCSNYATATTRRLTYHSTSPAGKIISRRLKHPSADYLAQIGGYLDAAATARAALQRPAALIASMIRLTEKL